MKCGSTVLELAPKKMYFCSTYDLNEVGLPNCGGAEGSIGQG